MDGDFVARHVVAQWGIRLAAGMIRQDSGQKAVALTDGQGQLALRLNYNCGDARHRICQLSGFRKIFVHNKSLTAKINTNQLCFPIFHNLVFDALSEVHGIISFGVKRQEQHGQSSSKLYHYPISGLIGLKKSSVVK